MVIPDFISRLYKGTLSIIVEIYAHIIRFSPPKQVVILRWSCCELSYRIKILAPVLNRDELTSSTTVSGVTFSGAWYQVNELSAPRGKQT